MNDNNLYTSHNLAISIKSVAKERNIIIKNMLSDLQLGSNTMSALYHGKALAFDSLAKIADYLDCSVDYLLGRTDVPEVNRGKTVSVETDLFNEIGEIMKNPINTKSHS